MKILTCNIRTSNAYHAFKGAAFDPETHRPFEGKPPLGKMDWILARGLWTVSEADVLKDHEQGRYPSDHYFISATLRPDVARKNPAD